MMATEQVLSTKCKHEDKQLRIENTSSSLPETSSPSVRRQLCYNMQETVALPCTTVQCNKQCTNPNQSLNGIESNNTSNYIKTTDCPLKALQQEMLQSESSVPSTSYDSDEALSMKVGNNISKCCEDENYDLDSDSRLFVCTCCHNGYDYKNVHKFTDSMYDFTNHNILKSLSHRCRKKDEFICHNCHISLTNDPPLIPHNCIYNELHDHNLLASCIMCKKQLYRHSMLQFKFIILQ